MQDDDGGLAIVRVKPIGAGGGGVEKSGIGYKDGEAGLRYESGELAGAGGGGRIDIVAGNKCNGKTFNYMRHVIPPQLIMKHFTTFFFPGALTHFLEGYNVNVIAYGQTGTGKTHTM